MNTDRLLVIGLAIALLLMVVLALPAATDEADGFGKARVVNVDELRRRMIRGELSEKEALYYRLGR